MGLKGQINSIEANSPSCRPRFQTKKKSKRLPHPTQWIGANHLSPQPSSQPSSRRSTPAPSNLSPCPSRPSSSSAPTSPSHPTKSTPRASQPHGLGSTSYSHEGGRSLARALVPGLGISLARGD